VTAVDFHRVPEAAMRDALRCHDKALKLIGICDITANGPGGPPLPRSEMIY